jgi:hypothetical protein
VKEKEPERATNARAARYEAASLIPILAVAAIIIVAALFYGLG